MNHDEKSELAADVLLHLIASPWIKMRPDVDLHRALVVSAWDLVEAFDVEERKRAPKK